MSDIPEDTEDVRNNARRAVERARNGSRRTEEVVIRTNEALAELHARPNGYTARFRAVLQGGTHA